MNTVRFTSCMAETSDDFCRAVTSKLGERLGIPTEFVDAVPWQERERLFDAGEIDVCWICGLPYVWKRDQDRPPVELLAAPVMQGERYANQPVYFSDIVVRRDGGFQELEDLRGASWVYNEPRSYSGYNIVRDRLQTMGGTSSFFARVIESGAHQASLDMILSGEVDASAIDSTVLEALIANRPAIANHITVIETLGPGPMPPWICHRALPQSLRDGLRNELLNLHRDLRAISALDAARVSHFAEVDDAFYDGIRAMCQRLAATNLSDLRATSNSG